MKASSVARKILSKFPRDIREYFNEIDSLCKENGITFYLGAGKSVNSGCGRSGGYYDDGERVLAVSIGCSLQSVLGILVHESKHCYQHIHQTPAWKNRKIYNGYNRFFSHLAGKRIYKKHTAVAAAIAIELECERMAVKEIKRRWTKYIDLSKYQRESSAYLYSYIYMGETGKWPVTSSCDRKITAHSPDKLLRSYKRIPSRLRMAFERYLR